MTSFALRAATSAAKETGTHYPGDLGRLMIEMIWIDAFYPKAWPYL
jgi:hypothetical protein